MTAIEKAAVSDFSHAFKLTTSGNSTLTTTRLVSLINSTADTHTVTVPTGKTRIIFNTSTQFFLKVSTTGQSVRDLRPGQGIVCSWDTVGAAHELALIGSAQLDSGPSDNSPNAAASGGIKAQLDALEAQIGGGAAQHIVLTGDLTLAGTESRILAIQCDDPLDELTIPSGFTCQIHNVTQNDSTLTVNRVGGSNTIKPHHSMWFLWDGAAHDFLGDPPVDLTVSGNSENAIANSSIKAYVDSAVVGGTLDSSMSDSSAAAVKNMVIKAYVDRSSMVRPNDVVLDINSTNQDWVDAASDLATDGGTIWLNGPVNWPTQLIVFTSPVSIRGMSADARLVGMNINGSFQWGSSTIYLASTTSSHANGSGTYLDVDVERFENSFKATGAGFKEDDWVVIYADEPWRDGPWHEPQSGMGFPAQLVQLRYNVGVDEFQIDGFFTDSMLTPPVGANVSVSGDTFTLTGHTLSNGDEVYFRYTTAPSGTQALFRYAKYIVRDVAAGTFKICIFGSDAALTFSSAGTGVKLYTFDSNVTADNATETFTLIGNDLTNGEQVFFKGTMPTGIIANQDYYVVNRTVDTFQVSTSLGGGAETFSSNGSGLTVHRSVLRPKAWKVPMLRPSTPVGVQGRKSSGIILDNFVVCGGNVNATTFSTFIGCDGVTIRDLVFERDEVNAYPPRTQMNFRNCANVLYENVYSDGSAHDEFEKATYQLVVEPCDRVRVRGNFGRRLRHFFTTGGTGRTVDGELRRYGNCTNTVVESNLMSGGYQERSSGNVATVVMDTHAEGYEVVFRGNVVFVDDEPGEQANAYAMQSRARYTRFIGNVVFAGAQSGGIRLLSYGETAIGNIVSGPFSAYTVSGSTVNYPRVFWGGQSFIGNEAVGGGDHSATAAFVLAGDNIRLVDNVVRDRKGKGVLYTGGTRLRIVGLKIFDNSDNGETGLILVDDSQFAVGRVAAETSDVRISGLYVDGYKEAVTAADAVVYFSGVGDGHRVTRSEFVNCKVASLIQFNGGTGHRVSSCEAEKMDNTYFVHTGSLGASDIKLIGNVADGYGAGSLGLNPAGTNAATINTNQAADNWTD